MRLDRALVQTVRFQLFTTSQKRPRAVSQHVMDGRHYRRGVAQVAIHYLMICVTYLLYF